MLVRLIYASRASGPIDEALVTAIIELSRPGNDEHGITGVLCTQRDHDVFVQVLEGERGAINALYGNIVRDPRHHDVLLLSYEEIEQRIFGGWRMGTIDLKRINLNTLLRYSERAVLDPHSMTGAGVLAMLRELTDSGAIVSS